MQISNIFTVLSDLSSRLIPGVVRILQGDNGEPKLFLSLIVRDDVEGQKWRQFEMKRDPHWRDRITSVTVDFFESAAHPQRSWEVASSLVAEGDGLVPDGAGPVVKVLLAFELAKPEDATVEETLPLVRTVTFGFAEAEEVEEDSRKVIRGRFPAVKAPSA